MKTTVAGCYFVNNFTQSKAYFTVFSISLPLNKRPLCLLSRFALSLEFRIKYHQLLHKIVFFSGIRHLAKKTSENTKKTPRSNSHNKSKQRSQAQVYYQSAVSSKITFVFIVCFILRPQPNRYTTRYTFCFQIISITFYFYVSRPFYSPGLPAIESMNTARERNRL